MSETLPQTPPAAESNWMQGLFKQLFGLSKDMVIYGLSGSLGQMVSLVTLPLLTRVLTRTQFGAMDLIYATVNYFSILMSLNVGVGLWRYYYEIPEDNLQERKKLFSSVLWFIIALGGSVALVLSLFAVDISNSLFHKPDFVLPIRLAIINLPIMAVFNLTISAQRLKRKPIIYLLINCGNSAIYLLLTVVLVGFVKIGIEGVYLAQIIAYSLGMVAGLWLSRDLLTFNFSKEWFIKAAMYGLPQAPASLFNWTLVAANRFFLNTYTNIEQVAYYSLANKVAQVMMLLIQAFTLAWQPFQFARLNDVGFRKAYSLILQYYMIGTLLFGAGLMIFARPIFFLAAPPSYLPGVGLIGLLVLRHVFQGVSYITSYGIALHKKTIYITISIGIGVVANLLLNMALTPHLGIQGTSIADMSGYMVGALANLYFSNRLQPMQWKLKPVGQILLGYTGLLVLTYLLLRVNIQPAWLLLIDLLLFSGFAAFLILFIEPATRSMIWNQGRAYLTARLKPSSKGQG